MEAFKGRGRMDFQASHDLEDFIAVIEGRETLLHEIAESPGDLQVYLRKRQDRCWRNPGLLMFFLDLPWTAREFP